jgi:hypothetical protein
VTGRSPRHCRAPRRNSRLARQREAALEHWPRPQTGCAASRSPGHPPRARFPPRVEWSQDEKTAHAGGAQGAPARAWEWTCSLETSFPSLGSFCRRDYCSARARARRCVPSGRPRQWPPEGWPRAHGRFLEQCLRASPAGAGLASARKKKGSRPASTGERTAAHEARRREILVVFKSAEAGAKWALAVEHAEHAGCVALAPHRTAPHRVERGDCQAALTLRRDALYLSLAGLASPGSSHAIAARLEHRPTKE